MLGMDNGLLRRSDSKNRHGHIRNQVALMVAEQPKALRLLRRYDSKSRGEMNKKQVANHGG